MKKYLIKGVLALFGGALMFSCAENETEYVPLAQQKLKTYEDVFKEVYGDNIDPYQDWGFTTKYTLADESTSEVVYIDSIVTAVATTRRAGTRTANPNANLWGRYYTNVPETLTVAQKKRVRLFFQYNQFPDDEPVHLTNFFVQDVYKGATTPLNDGTAEKAQYSTEKYSLNNSMEAGSAHMDYLTAGPANDHIYNYNNAKCSTNDKVWDGRTYEAGYPLTAETAAAKGIGDWEAENYNHVVYHSDEIMLMENSSTDCFGWHETVGTSQIQHNDQYRIISGATIDAWAAKFATTHPGLDLGASVTGRNFVGFDYERDSDFSSKFVRTWPNNEIDYYAPGIPYISNELHTYGHIVVQPDANGNYPAGSYPVKDRYVEGSNNTVNIWVKPTGCADGYFSDWIVCIVGAQGKTITSRIEEKPEITVKKVPVVDQCGRIFCEDLGVSSREDLDFNDVVFDVNIYKNFEEGTIYYTKIYSDGRKEDAGSTPYSTEDQALYTAEITLQAAGGTLPLTVADREVHAAFGEGITTMINTRDDNSTAFGSYVTGKSPVYLGSFKASDLKLNKSNSDPLYAIDIPIVVNYGNSQVNVLGATLGGTPAKLFVPNQTTKWTVERKPLSLAYPDFVSYVSNKSVQWWTSPTSNPELERANYYRYNNVTYQGSVTPPIVVTRISYPSVSQDILWGEDGPVAFDSWKLENLTLAFREFYPGDRLVFYGENLTDDSYITVIFSDLSKPYLIDTKFSNKQVDAKGNVTTITSGVVEITLDEDLAAKLNATVQATGTIQVQGRNFTLKRIGRTLFQ